MSTIKTVVRNRRIEAPAPDDLPDGTSVVLTILPATEETPVTPEEINRILAAMQKLQPLAIPENVARELDSWEQQLNQRGIEHTERDIEDVFL